jgi:hypothetical protein
LKYVQSYRPILTVARFHGGDPLVVLSRRITELRDFFYTAVENDEAEKALRCVSEALGMFDAVSGVAGSMAFKLPSGEFLEFKPVSSENGKERRFVLLKGESRRLSKEKPDPHGVRHYPASSGD